MSETKNVKLAANLAVIVVGMVLLSYASVPLYRLFCQVTGYGGTTAEGTTDAAVMTNRDMKITFNADISPELAWEFKPGEPRLKVKVGEQRLTYYVAKNTTDKPLKGHATYNVVPHKAGPYFTKVECFCFTEQTLQPGEEVKMPISFYIDPAMLEDPDMKDVYTITLSYTFFPVKKDGI